MIQLAAVAAQLADTSPSTVLFEVLRFVIYDVLGPSVYGLILIFGIEMAVPGGTPVRALFRRHGAVSPVKLALANDPHTRTLSVVAVLLALSFWASVATAWLSGYWHHLPHPRLTNATVNDSVIFAAVLVVGLIAGDLWARGVRSVKTARSSLGVLAISMALSGTLLFFYIVEPPLQDALLVASLGIFVGELGVAARHPSIFHEGLFDVLRSPLESDLEEEEEEGDDARDDGEGGERRTSRVAWLSTQTRAIRERLAAQKPLSVGASQTESPMGSFQGDSSAQREPSHPRPV